MISTLRTCTHHVNVVCQHHNLNDHSIHMAMTIAHFTIVWLIMHISRTHGLLSFRSCVDQISSVAQVFFDNDGHSPSTVFWKHGAADRCSGNANALGSAVPSSRSCNKQTATTAAAPPFEAHTDAPSPAQVAAQPCFQAITASRGHRSADQEAPSWQV